MDLRSVCLLVVVAVYSTVAVPLYQAPPGLHYEAKKDLHEVPLAKDLHQPIKPMSYPFFYPYYSPYYFPNFYYPYHYYNKAVLNKDAKQAPVSLKAPVYGFKPPVYDFKAAKDGKFPQYPVPQYFYNPYHVKKEELKPVEQHPEPAPVAPEPVAPVVHEEEYKPVIHQEYKEVEMFPEVQEVAHEEQKEQQIVHKDEPAFRSFIFIGKYSG